jgi:hypothetical protein
MEKNYKINMEDLKRDCLSKRKIIDERPVAS